MNKTFLIKFFASGFYSSYSKIVPGTTGTIPAWLIAYFLVGDNSHAVIIGAVALTVISVWLASLAEPIYGHDAKKIVIDEWAGMFITLILVPFSLLNYIIAFVAFRGFDAVKIWPANVAEKLPRGWGVTADDVVAGIQANLSTHLIVYIIKLYI
ncbi:MAG: phosphatidylglycerophosphatase A [candidate division Zixibacteria bacterium HGW-Zixibacteria-1]|nr:MAG: phosphatidylglycerophosphatase A [candidate division Zixibacteria bacterium HGW-Zixibacteria-1]